MKFLRKKNTELSLEVTPLIDIVFLLLIFFVLNSQFDKFTSMEQSTLEKEERLEQLRAIQNSLKINLILIDDKIISIDTLDDVERLMKAQKGQD